MGETLGVVLSRFCMAKCGHCGSSADPSRPERLDRDRLDLALRGARANGATSVAFTGGEPLAHKRLALDAIQMASAMGLDTTVCTNAFWAESAASTESLLDELVAAGLDRVHLSTDRWHVDFIPVERVVAAARGALARGLDVQVAIPAGRSDWQAFDLLDAFAAIDGLDAAIHPAHPVGRGEHLPTGALQVMPPALAPCHLAGHVEVDFDGRASICPTSADFGPDSVLRLGLADEDFAARLDRSARTPLVHLISRWGPVGAAMLAGRSHEVGGYRHDCHLCRALHSDRSNCDAIAERTGIDVLSPVPADELGDVMHRIDHLVAEVPVTLPC